MKYARLTGDVDFFYEPTTANVTCLYNALLDFWEGKIPGVKCSAELQTKGTIFQFGVPPNRIDLINSLDAVSFEEAWESRKEEKIKIEGKDYKVYYIGLEPLIKNKLAIKRYKDLEDLKYLKEAVKAKK